MAERFDISDKLSPGTLSLDCCSTNRGFMTVVEDLSYISKTASSLSCLSNYVGAMFALS